MQVMLTGGTGFLGGHVMRGLVDAGHRPQLLVRDAAKLDRMLALHGVDPAAVESSVGDILDPDSVARALVGCDACIHAAAFTTLDVQEMPKALGINEPGARNVLDAAVAAGCDPIVHVSTMSVVFPPQGAHLSADDPVQGGGAPYNASKAEADLYARSLQDAGHPVVIVYPAGVVGPLDLGTNQCELVLGQLLGAEFLLKADTGGYLFVDVRDIASATAALVVPGRGPRRYMMGGHYLDWDQFAAVAHAVTGLERATFRATRADLEATLDAEAVDIMLGIGPSDDEPLQRDTGVEWRPFEETLRDTLRWMVAEGRLDARWAPGLS